MSEKSTQSICNFNEYYKHYLALFVLTIVTFSHLVQAQPSDDEAGDNLITPEIIKTLENYSEKYRQQLVVPGMAIAIVHNGKIVYAKGLGYRQIGRQKTVNAKTLFSIGSLSKSMTAMMAGSIVDDGYMQWDTPINQVLPQFELSDPMVTQQITMKNLFSHSTGISPVDQMLMLSGLSFPEYLRYIKTVPLLHPVGTVFNYSNTMYSLGGYAAVAATGELKEDEWLESYRELMHERVFEPIGMKHSGLSAEFIEESKNRAFGHRSNLQANMTSAGFDVFTEAYWDIETQGPAGAVRSNAVDMAKYLITILNHGISPKGDVVISPSSST
ncbi:MAG: beta-lactamase family protein, partial [Gammaproteobacteria bacterium]|nr:beta-lactamase family protein [Gammaproteobacteria bacterium]